MITLDKVHSIIQQILPQAVCGEGDGDDLIVVTVVDDDDEALEIPRLILPIAMKDNDAVVDDAIAVGMVAGREIVGGAQSGMAAPILAELLVEGEEALTDEIIGLGVPA